ncbi:unnamed protein product, partial [Oppiella nova]
FRTQSDAEIAESRFARDPRVAKNANREQTEGRLEGDDNDDDDRQEEQRMDRQNARRVVPAYGARSPRPQARDARPVTTAARRPNDDCVARVRALRTGGDGRGTDFRLRSRFAPVFDLLCAPVLR